MATESETKKITYENEDQIVDKTINSNKVYRWENLNLKQDLLKGIYSVGFDNPSFIQKEAIPHIISGRNLRAQAQSGTGKTGAFVIGALQKIDQTKKVTQCLVLASTREIAIQNANKFKEIGAYMNITVCVLLGGISTRIDKVALADTPHVIVGTPGRVFQMIDRNELDTSNIKIFILDEADEMLRAEFEEQVKNIYMRLNLTDLQVMLFSATYSEKELNIIKNIMEDPVEIDLRHEDQTLQGIKQLYVDIGESHGGQYDQVRRNELTLKVYTILDIFKEQSLSQVLIFVDKKSDAQFVAEMLNNNNFSCELISSDLGQEARTKTLENFKAGKCRVLVSSGLCKRGIDVQTLSLVVCLDVPSFENKNDYIHRVGRSGRYGRKGIALHILNSNETETLRTITDYFNSAIQPLPQGFNFKE